MTARIDLFAPATITAYAGGVSSLGAAPPNGVLLRDPGGGTVTLSIVAADAGTAFLASSAGGAGVAINGNTVTLTGLAAQVNAALATLEIFEPAGAANDTISLTATEAGELAASTDIVVEVASTIGPAFAAPPASLALAAWSLDSIPGLVIGDPALQSLIAAGQGAEETLQLTLSVASGVLLLPSFSKLSGISASGIGSSEVLLTFTGDQLAAVNALLADLVFAGPAGISGLAYGLRDLSGPLGATVTSGNISLGITGTAGGVQTIVTGPDTVILGEETVLGGTITVSAVTSDIGGLYGSAALSILPDAAFNIPYNTLELGGTSFDDGTLEALALFELGTLAVDGAATIGGLLYLGTRGVIDLSGTLAGAAQAHAAGQEAISLASGAVLAGEGELDAGNFSNAGRIFGPGTILAAQGGMLVISAAEISGNANVDVGAGAVVEIGPVDPLFGVFDATALTIDAGTTLDFLGANGPDAVTGAFGDNLDERGGAIVISSPDVFFGTIVNFAPGDRLIFPGLTGLTLLSITSESFIVAGVDGSGDTVEYTINAAYPAGDSPFVYTDNEGDGEVALRGAVNEVLLGGTLAAAGVIDASSGVAQPILGLSVLLRSWTTQSLRLTLSVADGILSGGTVAPGGTITLTAATPALLDAALESLTYTETGNVAVDQLLVTAASGYLNGLSASVPIEIISTPGTVAGFGDAGQVALFAGGFGGLIEGFAAPGEVLITGTADFADAIDATGLGGTALRIDAGGIGVFDAAAAVTLDGGATIGDAGGAGFLAIYTDAFSVAGGLVLGGNAAAASSGADVLGAVSVAGVVQIGAAAVTDVYLYGTLAAASVSIGSAGTLIAGAAAAENAGLFAVSGTALLDDQAIVTAASASLAGTVQIGGTALLAVANGVAASGLLAIGPDAELSAAALAQTSGALSLAGTLAVVSLTADSQIWLAGGTIFASTISLSGGTLAGFGDIEAAGGLAALALTGATILATGPLDIGADIAMSGAGEIVIAAAASLELDHAVSGGTILFSGAHAILTVDDPQEFRPAVAGMLAHDVIDLTGVAPGNVTFSGGSITETDAQGQLIGSFALSVASGQPAVQLAADGQGGTLITLGGDMPCFARGTRLLTPSGYRPVECLAPGDLVVTAAGRACPVRWIGRRTLDLAAASPGQPVMFDAGALGPGVPQRPVKLSPLHAVFVDGVLVPALHLINGATIRRQSAGAVTYFHIELDRHDIVLAEAMPVETFLDNGNRGSLYEETGVRVGSTAPCARLVTAGPALAKIRRRLQDVALAAGYRLTYDAGLRGIAAGTALLPRITRRGTLRIARFNLPPHADALALVARSAAPADTDPDSEDRRQLGICLAGCSAGAALKSGWLPRGAEDAGHWMPGSAKLSLRPGLRTMTLHVAAIVQSWRLPDHVRRR